MPAFSWMDRSHGLKLRASMLFTPGQAMIQPSRQSPSTGELGKDIREQTCNVLERIKAILADAATSLDNVLTTTMHLTKREGLAPCNEEYAATSLTASRPGPPWK